MICFDAFTCEVLDFVENMYFPCQIFLLWKALDFVEGNSLPCRAEIGLVKNFLVPDVGALYRIRGPSTTPQIARGIFKGIYKLYICVHTLDPEISVSGPWLFLLQVSPDPFVSFMAIRPRRVLHRGPVASYCPVILHPEVSVSYWHLSSFLVGLFAGLVISFVTFLGFSYGCRHSS